jgi:hypothetical protein
MRKLVLAVALLASTAFTANAATVANLGVNPTSASGAFSHTVGGGAFSDQITFSLAGGPQFLTIASVTNVYPEPSDFITSMTGSVFYAGANGVPGGGDDVQVIGPILATACPLTPSCQGFAGSAILTLAGNYFLNISGVGGGTSGYGGNLAVAQVPIPPAAGLFALGLAGIGLMKRKRKTKTRDAA